MVTEKYVAYTITDNKCFLLMVTEKDGYWIRTYIRSDWNLSKDIGGTSTLIFLREHTENPPIFHTVGWQSCIRVWIVWEEW